jgi:hypothetical protein
MFTSLVSLVTGRTVGHDLAMTGEISLRGLVLPVGGIKEKTVAAHRAGIRKVLLPARNRKDLEDVPQSVRDEIEFVFCERVEDVIREALGIEAKVVAAACREHDWSDHTDVGTPDRVGNTIGAACVEAAPATLALASIVSFSDAEQTFVRC